MTTMRGVVVAMMMLMVSGLVGCGSSYSSGSTTTTSGWTVENSSGTVVAGTGFISTDGSPALATGGVTQGLTAGDFAVEFFDANNGWFVGNLGEILHTTDAGYTVTRLNFTGSDSILRAVHPVSTAAVYIAGRDSVDGGASVFYSADTGSTWTVQGNTATTYPGRSITSTDRLNALSFLNSTSALVVGGLGDNTNIIWKTTDGTTWVEAYHAATSGTDDELQGVSFVSSDVAYAVGNTGVILKTSDGGTSWTQQTSGTTQNLHDIVCSDISTCILVGNSGTILGTTNGGTTWTTQTSGTTNDLSALGAASASKLWAGGASGTLLYSSDSGATWTSQTSNTTYPIQAITMISDTVGWAVAADTTSNQGAILYTSTGGQ